MGAQNRAAVCDNRATARVAPTENMNGGGCENGAAIGNVIGDLNRCA